MYVYFDERRVLRERVFDTLPMDGDSGFTAIHLHWGSPLFDEVSGVTATFHNQDGSVIGTPDLVCDMVEAQLPETEYIRKQDLQWFEEYRDYRFAKIAIPTAVTHSATGMKYVVFKASVTLAGQQNPTTIAFEVSFNVNGVRDMAWDRTLTVSEMDSLLASVLNKLDKVDTANQNVLGKVTFKNQVGIEGIFNVSAVASFNVLNASTIESGEVKAVNGLSTKGVSLGYNTYSKVYGSPNTSTSQTYTLPDTSGQLALKSAVDAVDARCDDLQEQIDDIGGGEVTKAYVDQQDAALGGRIDDLSDAVGDLSDSVDQDVQDLNERIDNVSSIGRYLSGWDCFTGLPTTDPATELPYEYKSGDYFRVESVDVVNYKPSGSEYDGEASTALETAEVKVGDLYLYDGNQWTLQIQTTREVGFGDLTGSPSDNTGLGNVLEGLSDEIDGKQDAITWGNGFEEDPSGINVKAGTGITVDSNGVSIDQSALDFQAKATESLSGATSFSGSLTSNVDYSFSNAMTSLSVTGLSVASGDTAPYWSLCFRTASSVSVSFPSSVSWVGGEPQFEANTQYVVIVRKSSVSGLYIAALGVL